MRCCKPQAGHYLLILLPLFLPLVFKVPEVRNIRSMLEATGMTSGLVCQLLLLLLLLICSVCCA